MRQWRTKLVPRRRIPHLRGVIIGRRHYVRAIGAECRPGDSARMLQRRAHWLSVRASQTRAVSSSDAVTTRVPSPLNAADLIIPLCFSGAPTGWPVRASHTRAVSSSDAVTTRAPSVLNAAELNTARMLQWRAHRLARPGVPYAGSFIVGGRHYKRAVGAEGRRPDYPPDVSAVR